MILTRPVYKSSTAYLRARTARRGCAAGPHFKVTALQDRHPAEKTPPLYRTNDALTDGALLVIAVEAEDARKVNPPQILSRGYVSGVDAWFVA